MDDFRDGPGIWGTLLGMDVIRALRRTGGAGRRRNLPGITRTQLTRAVQRGDVLQPLPGLYALPDCAPAVLAATAVGGVLSCASAAADRGLPVLDVIRPPHVTAARGTVRRWPRTVVHRRDVPHDGVRTDLLQTVLDCLRCCPPHEGVAIADHALRHELLSVEDLRNARERLHPNDSLRARIALVDGRAMSPPESWARVHLVLAGFTLDVQVPVAGVGWVDILIDDWLVVEIDGVRYHREPLAFADDRRRDRAAYPGGRVVIRFPAREVLHEERFVREVRAVHEAGRPRG